MFLILIVLFLFFSSVASSTLADTALRAGEVAQFVPTLLSKQDIICLDSSGGEEEEEEEEEEEDDKEEASKLPGKKLKIILL